MSAVTVVALAAALAGSDSVWRAGLAAGLEDFSRDRSTWRTAQLSLSRRAGGHTFGLEAGLVERFDQTDRVLSGETWLRLAPRRALHLRAGIAPGADIIARSDLSAELYAGVGGGWEISFGYRRMDFDADNVDLLSASAATYRGLWYFRARGTGVPTAGSLGLVGALTARRYLGPRLDSFVEITGGGGREVVLLGPGPAVELRGTGFVAARAESRFGPRWGLGAGVSWNAEREIPSRYGLLLGAFALW